MVARLLLHYPAGLISAGVRQAMAQDWLDDLREFGPVVVGEACKRWRRQPGGKRPTPGDIRMLCIEEQREYGTGLPRLPPPQRVVPNRSRYYREMEQEGRLASNQWAGRQGYVDFDEYLAAGGSYAKAIAAMMGWEDLPAQEEQPRAECRTDVVIPS